MSTGAVDVAAMRENYTRGGLAEADIAGDWITQFGRWFSDAVAGQLPEPNAFVLATASPDGDVSCRTVLAKQIDATGVVFYTNYTSAKSQQLLGNPRAAATFPWIALERQVHVRGPVERVDEETTRTYWRKRPRGSQLGAWASPQSSVVASRAELDAMQASVEARFGPADVGEGVDAADIPPPPFWGGWRIVPRTVEFWQGRRGRMHDRLRFRDTGDAGWVLERIAP